MLSTTNFLLNNKNIWQSIPNSPIQPAGWTIVSKKQKGTRPKKKKNVLPNYEDS